MLFRELGRLALLLCILGFSHQNARALIVNATFSSAADIPVTSNGYAADGNSVEFTLGFPPNTGTTLTVVKNTGLAFIDGVFSNLSQGQEVSLDHGGKTYKFVANYFGGSGNDLVLQWAATRAVAFGNNAYGQLGNGTTTNSSIQIAVNSSGLLAGKTIIAIAAGGRHSLALCSDGTLAAWGYNFHGQLGNNSQVYSHVPVAVDMSGVLAGKTVAAIAAGEHNSFALCSDGTVVSWGNNTSGQAGTGNAVSEKYLTPVAVDTSGTLSTKSVVAISAGCEHCLALCTDGTIAAWGNNSDGRLGNGQSATSSPSPVAVDLSGALSGKTITDISAGGRHSLALCDDGTLAAWGYNISGQLGIGTTVGSIVPVASATAGTMEGKSAVAIICGDSHSIALCSDGSMFAWGSGSPGQLGNNNIFTYYQPTAVDISGVLSGKTITTLAAGSRFSIAMCSDGTLTAWGDNLSGQLGDASTQSNAGPVAVSTSTLAAGKKFVAGTSSASANHTLAIVAIPYIPRIAVEEASGTEWKSDHLAFDFGSCPAASTISKNFTIRNGGIVPLNITDITLDGPNASDFAITTPPAAIVQAGSTTTFTVTFTAGEGFTRCAVLHLASDAPYNPVFNLDLAATVAQPFPITYSSGTDIPLSAKAFTASGSSVSFSLAHAPATGTALMVLENTGIDFIHGTFSNLLQGQEVSLDHGGKTYKFVANYFGGSGNDLVLQWAATRAAAFGANGNGQLGNGSTVNSSLQIGVNSTGVLAGKTVTAIAAGGSHSLALCSDGTVAAWGYNLYGQLGNNSTVNSSVPVAVNRSGVLAGKTVVAIAAGDRNSLALCSDGTLASWGNNYSGQLGKGDNFGWYLSPVAVDTSGVLYGKTVVAIAAGREHCLALCSDGTLAAWGYNYEGQLGNGQSAGTSLSPVAVDLSGVLSGKTITGIAAGEVHSMAICNDGSLAAWGANNGGQFGNGSSNYKNPAPVAAGTTGAMLGKSAVAVACGSSHSIALAADGALAAWGYGSYGQLGNNSISSSDIPVAVNASGVLSGKTITALAAGKFFSLAMCSDGTLAAWGDNYNGQVGDNSTIERRVPVAVTTATLAAGEKFIAGTSSSTAYHSLAIVAMPYISRIAVEQPAGTEWKSGRRALDFGSCPAASTISKTFTLRNNGIVPLAITGVTLDGPNASDFAITTPPAASVEAGSTTTLTVTFTADAGFNRSAVLHVASNDPNNPIFNLDLVAAVARAFPIVYDSSSDVPVTTKAFTATGSSVSFSLAHAPATGTALTVVENTGLGFINGTFSNLSQGQEIALAYNGTTYRFVANYFGGTGNDLVLQWAATRLLAWGDNFCGQLGIGSLVDADRPTAVSTMGVLGGKTILSTAHGFGMSLAVCSDGTLASWGRNYAGQLGNGNTTDSNVPVAVNQTGVLAGKKVVAASVGYDHCVVLCSDGTLAAWGDNLSGKLGDGGYTDSSIPVTVNQPALSGKSVVAIAAGYDHNLALCSDGTVVSWGSGTGAVDTLGVLFGKTVVSISASHASSFALCSDGTLVGWGSNYMGTLGTGTFGFLSERNPLLVYTSGALSGKAVTAIAAAYNHSLALCSDGTLFCWGNNSYGQLGNGTNNESSEAVAVDHTGVLAGKTVVAAAAGYQYNLARCSDGSLVTWGDGSDGKLGIGGFSSKTVPVIVQATALAAGEKIISATTAHYSIHSLATVAIPAIPRIVLEQPAATGWASGRGCFDFGGATPGNGIAKTFTVRNAGIEPLVIGGVLIDGVNAADFTLTTPPASTVAAGASTTFTVTFTAATGIARSAMLHIASSDPYTTDFLLEMTGTVTGTLNMVYNTGAETLVSTPGFTATGSSISFSLGQAPATGSELTVIRNTGLGFINGTFDNLTHGQVVILEFGGIAYQFVANYYGGNGNDLVLQWSPTRPYAWGNNASGQLGIGSATNQTLPAAVTATGALAGKTVISVATGSSHSLALCSDGTLAAWGSNSSGQFGIGNTTSSNVPVLAGIGGALSGKRVVAIAAGSNFSLALCSDGTLTAWGSNTYGQLGNGTTTSSNAPVAVIATEAITGKKVVAVATGSNHCLALCSDGTTASWGYNMYGQLGDNSVTDRYAPVAVSSSGPLSGKTVTAVTAGPYSSLALCSDGTVASWGYNDRGQLGDNSNVNRNVPVQVETSGALSGKEITAIAAGTSHTLASCSDGTLVTWGYNANGQLGIGNTTSSLVPVAVNMTGVLSGKTVVTLAAGSNHCLVRCSDGVTAAWGANSNGQLGDNSTSTRNFPVLVKTTSIAPGQKFIKATSAALASHNLALVAIPYIPRLALEQPANIALTSGSSAVDFPSSAPNSATLKTFTLRNFGILPLAINSVTITGPQASEFVLTSPPATSLEPGASTTLTITFTSGAGFNRRAELHLNSNDPYLTDFGINLTSGGTGTLAATYASASDLPLVAAGFTATGSSVNFSIAYPPATGTTLTVVRNTSRESIQGSFNNLVQGQEIVLVYGGKKYRYIANYFGGDGNDLILQWADVRPICWGRNTNGQLGIGGTTSSSLPLDVSMTGALAGKTVMSMAAGGSHSLALCTDGTLTAWGLGTSGQLGTGTNTSSDVPVAVNLAGTLSGKRVIAIAAGFSHNLALCSDGTVRAWGSNFYGQLGNGSNSTALNPVAVNASGVLSGKKVIAIAAGQYHSLALCSDGTLASWGFNSSGQLGTGNTANRNVPTAVNQSGILSGKTIVSVAAGLSHSLVLCSDGTLASWGSNYSRQLGNGSSLSSSVPVTVDTFLMQGGEIPIAITSGDSHNLVQCSNGSLFAWGDNIYGQLGNDTLYQSGIPVPVNMAGVLSGKSITMISAGSGHSMAFASDATVYSWGLNSSGQLGDGTTMGSTSPVAVNLGNLSVDERIIGVFSGPTAFHSFAMVAAPALNLTPAEDWRMTHFQTIANSGNAADLATPQNDGIVNLMKFATGMNPTQPGRTPGNLENSGENLVFTYSRSKAAVLDGLTFTFEWSETLAPGGWRQDGVLLTEEDRGDTHLVTASLPKGNSQRLFVRLRVERP